MIDFGTIILTFEDALELGETGNLVITTTTPGRGQSDPYFGIRQKWVELISNSSKEVELDPDLIISNSLVSGQDGLEAGLYVSEKGYVGELLSYDEVGTADLNGVTWKLFNVVVNWGYG